MIGVDLTFGDELEDDGVFEDDINLESASESPHSFFATESDSELDEELTNFDLVDEEVPQGEEVNLSVLDFRSEINEREWNTVEYPSLFIEGMETEEEFAFFRNKGAEGGDTLPLYCIIEGTPVKVCQLPVCLQTFLDLYIIGGYKVKLYKTAEQHSEIPIDDPIAIVKFIKL